jgi:hypothetical protein
VNGLPTVFHQTNNIVWLTANFAGAPFERLQQIGDYDPNFTGGIYSTQLTIPSAVFQQLAARAQAWPIPYTADDLKSTWLGSQRLLLFVNLANPDPSLSVSLKIDGQPVALKPSYMTVYPLGYNNTFVGWYADLSALAPDVSHQFELTLPPLSPGRFQGMFLDNVEAQFTNLVQATGAATTTLLSSASNPSVSGANIGFTAYVQTNGQTAAAADGSMIFSVNQIPVWTNAVRGGAATFFTSSLAVGTNEVTAAYSGTSSYLPSVSTAVDQVVQIPSAPIDLKWAIEGTNLIFAWPSNYLGWILQMQTNPLSSALATNWVDVPGTALMVSTNLPLSPQYPSVFYRLKHP